MITGVSYRIINVIVLKPISYGFGIPINGKISLRTTGIISTIKARPIFITKAGIEAGKNARPIPMYVIDQGIPIDRIDDGACGFAWIAFPGNTSFGKWAKKQGLARSHYPSGLCVWVSEFGQSVDRKDAFAGAYAKVLKDNGIDAYSGSRLD